jgi:hypothetical protein
MKLENSFGNRTQCLFCDVQNIAENLWVLRYPLSLFGMRLRKGHGPSWPPVTACTILSSYLLLRRFT